MSTTLTRRQLHIARQDAEAFKALFPESCYATWTFAGSLRRGRPNVGDIEHVIIPRIGEIDVGGGLFPEMKPVNLLFHRLEELLKAGHVAKAMYGGHNPQTGVTTPERPKWGDKARGVLFREFKHEIYLADADNYGSVLAIRTGPGLFSKMLVTSLQRSGFWNNGGYVLNRRDVTCECGWRGAAEDGRITKSPLLGDRPTYQNAEGDYLLCPKCGYGSRVTMKRMPAPDEETYFKFCGLRWIEPAQRFDPEQKATVRR